MTASRRIRSPRADKANILINREKAALTAGATAMMGPDFPQACPAERRTGREIINADQALILQDLRDAGPKGGLTMTELVLIEREMHGLYRGPVARAMADLRERELVIELSPKQGNVGAKWGASMQGRRAFFDHLRQVQKLADRAAAAPPPTFNTKGSSYTPPANVFYRNNGNKHIPSLGVRC